MQTETPRPTHPARACAAHLSSLHLLGLLDDDDRLRIRSALPSLTVARAAVDDALLTRDHVGGIAAATFTASLAANGTHRSAPRSPPLSRCCCSGKPNPRNHRGLRARAVSSTPGDAAAGAIALAKEHQFALWCDDISFRQKARIAGTARGASGNGQGLWRDLLYRGAPRLPGGSPVMSAPLPA